VPKQPKKDYFKYIDNDKITLRFLSRLNTKVVEDVDRRFLISFFLADDSIQVYEMPNRNSGKFYFIKTFLRVLIYKKIYLKFFV
jgi:hypothetical protein